MLLETGDIVDLIMRIAFANYADFVRIDKYGQAVAKDLEDVDAQLIESVMPTKSGVAVKLIDRKWALNWLSNHFEMNPMDSHKKKYDEKLLELQERKIKIWKKGGDIMAQDWAVQFYSSKAWQNLRWQRILEEQFICQECHENYMLHPEKLIGHHSVELSPENITNPNIALNSSLIKIVCKKCHDKLHKRFGYNRMRDVTIVYGAPCSGKIL